MRRLLLVALATIPLAACEFDTSPEHAAYCASGGFWGCGHGTRLVTGATAGAVGGLAVQPQPVYAAPPPASTPMTCTTRNLAGTLQTVCN